MKKILSVLLLGTVLGCLMPHKTWGNGESFLTFWNEYLSRVKYSSYLLKETGRLPAEVSFNSGYLAGSPNSMAPSFGAGYNAGSAPYGGYGYTGISQSSPYASGAGAVAQTAEQAAFKGAQGTVTGLTEGLATQPFAWEQAADGTIQMAGQTFKSLDEVAAKFGNEVAKQMSEQGAKSASELAGKAATKGAEEGSKGLMDRIEEIMAEQTVSWNYGQYAVQIGQALVAKDTDDATKEVKVKGADPMGGSQGSPNSSSGTQTIPEVNSPISGSTVIESVNALLTLIQLNPIDISLLSTTVEQNNTQTLSPLTMGSSGSQAGLDIIHQGVTDGNQSSYTAYEKREIFNRRKLLLAEWAAAATQIGEGSNAISSAFYERAKTFIDAASASNGSIGGVSTINDSDRFVLFELTRGALLSAVQLGLQSSVTLSELEVVPPTTTPAQGAVSLPGNQSQ